MGRFEHEELGIKLVGQGAEKIREREGVGIVGLTKFI